MPKTIRYGLHESIDLNLRAEQLVAEFPGRRIEPLDDPAAAVAAALSSPLEFPPLSQATVAGDRIAVTLEPGVPRGPELLAGVIHALVELGADPQLISVVVGSSVHFDAAHELDALLPEETRRALDIRQHDHGESNASAYLAATKDGQPIYLNRAICDADVVLPIGVFRSDDRADDLGIHCRFVSTFSDEATRQRFTVCGGKGGHRRTKLLREAADEAAWLLGIQFSIQVIPGPGETVLHVLAGAAEKVASEARSLSQAAWACQLSERAGVVVATVDGGPEQQTWENVSRAVRVARHAVASDGAIAICSELAELAPAVGNSSRDSESASEEFAEGEYLPPADFFAEDFGEQRVYLLSRLSSESVEELGFAPVARADEIQRLCEQNNSCILLNSAQNAILVPSDE